MPLTGAKSGRRLPGISLGPACAEVSDQRKYDVAYSSGLQVEDANASGNGIDQLTASVHHDQIDLMPTFSECLG